jgi:hypothetical protein
MLRVLVYFAEMMVVAAFGDPRIDALLSTDDYNNRIGQYK